MTSLVANGDTSLVSDDSPINGTRRSGRAKKVPLKYVIPAETTKPSEPSQPPIRQNRPKRKAAQIAEQNIVPEDIGPLHEELFSSMDYDERKNYHGWVELESEPAFFNAMLQEMGAKNLKVQELFGLDDMTLSELPQPVHGLIFLYEWTNADESSDARQDCPDNLWFGNQTTANACATVALINIVMNARNAGLGPELQKFKNLTMSLPPPHRGHALDNNDFIRGIHNSVARSRADLISEDLLLENKFEVAEKKRKLTAPKRKALPTSRKKAQRETSYHYIAYVPVEGQVWELDGFEAKPLSLGLYEDSWLSTASQAIQARMLRDDSEFMSYNLLAICQSPLTTISDSLAANLACAHALEGLFSGGLSWNVPSPWKTFPDDRLAKFNLRRDQITERELPATFTSKSSRPDFDLAAARKLAEELHADQEALEAQYVAELATVQEAVEMIRGRQRDYTPAVHQWVRLLAEKGELREFIQQIDRES
ncbi:Uu.00g136020.m01.CDS01 [Anthostomella pinea]|uniref:Ubiquitin carboxyl-terminal hydrolase n=1 Tax=Anthostomella pinea TaxID=933095 RepID=A0AAI8VQF2_9PEZI|nr:Uu.00g136020.m01.CDS01 [Anthostomella pinea]